MVFFCLGKDSNQGAKLGQKKHCKTSLFKDLIFYQSKYPKKSVLIDGFERLLGFPGYKTGLQEQKIVFDKRILKPKTLQIMLLLQPIF
jgi:hypothetical protein